MTTLILIDAKNAIYRFGFAHRSLSSGRTATGALYGVLDALVRLKKVYSDSQFVMVWDGPGKSWRHRFYPEYKGNRTADRDKPDEVRAVLEQIPILKKILGYMGIPQLEVPCVEADDLIGMAAIMHRAFGKPVVVYSSDKDFMQLMAAGVTVIKPTPFSAETAKTRLEPETAESVMARFGCKPDEILKIRAFAGDKSDNIPVAVAGIGEKRALLCLRAGADPAKAKLECADLKWFGKLHGHWADVRRNYTLMQIAAFPDPKLFGTEVVSSVKIAMHKAQCDLHLESRGDMADVETSEAYWSFLCLLMKYELWEAVENRFRLWWIQSDACNRGRKKRG